MKWLFIFFVFSSSLIVEAQSAQITYSIPAFCADDFPIDECQSLDLYGNGSFNLMLKSTHGISGSLHTRSHQRAIHIIPDSNSIGGFKNHFFDLEPSRYFGDFEQQPVIKQKQGLYSQFIFDLTRNTPSQISFYNLVSNTKTIVELPFWRANREQILIRDTLYQLLQLKGNKSLGYYKTDSVAIISIDLKTFEFDTLGVFIHHAFKSPYVNYSLNLKEDLKSFQFKTYSDTTYTFDIASGLEIASMHTPKSLISGYKSPDAVRYNENLRQFYWYKYAYVNGKEEVELVPFGPQVYGALRTTGHYWSADSSLYIYGSTIPERNFDNMGNAFVVKMDKYLQQAFYRELFKDVPSDVQLTVEDSIGNMWFSGVRLINASILGFNKIVPYVVKMNPDSIFKETFYTEKIALHPNPASTIVRFKANKLISKCVVSSVSGAIHKEITPNREGEFNYELNVSDLETGYYHLQFIHETESVYPAERLLILR